jgi:DNA polymerase III psi subunit
MDIRLQLLKTIEAASRRWYPNGISRALAEELTKELVRENRNQDESLIFWLDQRLKRENLNQDVDQNYKYFFVVPQALPPDQEKFFESIVLKGLNLRLDQVKLFSLEKKEQIPTSRPIFCCGVSSKAISFLPDLKKDENSTSEEILGSTNISSGSQPLLIESVSLSDAMKSAEKKRALWSDLKRLIGSAKEL